MSYYQQQPQYVQQGYQQQPEPQYYQQEQQQQYYYQQDQQQQQYYQQQQVPQSVYYQDQYGNYYDPNQQQEQQQIINIDVSGDPGDTIVIEQQADGTFTQKRISARERELANTDPTKALQLSADEAISVLQRERAQQGNANTFDSSLVANIATKWNVSPPKERSMKYLVADLREHRSELEEEQEKKQQQNQNNNNNNNATTSRNVESSAKSKPNEKKQPLQPDDDSIVVIGNVELPPNVQLRAAQYRAAAVLAPARGTGFDTMRNEGRPVPPTEESLRQSDSDFRTALDFFKVGTSTLMAEAGAEAKRNKKGGGFENENPSANALSRSFDAADLDQIEISEIDQRERKRDEMAALRDELIKVSNQVLHAHERLKKEGGKANEATQLIAHRPPPAKRTATPTNRKTTGTSPPRSGSVNVSRTSTNVSTTTPKKSVVKNTTSTTTPTPVK
jgi:hypothetical protein